MFHEQDLGSLLSAREQASAILRNEDPHKRRILSLEEAVIFQAASHLLTSADVFYGTEVIRLSRLGGTGVYTVLSRMERGYKVVTSTQGEGLRAPRSYKPTELGTTVFNLFQHRSPQPGRPQ